MKYLLAAHKSWILTQVLTQVQNFLPCIRSNFIRLLQTSNQSSNRRNLISLVGELNTFARCHDNNQRTAPLIEEASGEVLGVPFRSLSLEKYCSIRGKRIRARRGRRIARASRIVIARSRSDNRFMTNVKETLCPKGSPHARNGNVTHEWLGLIGSPRHDKKSLAPPPLPPPTPSRLYKPLG